MTKAVTFSRRSIFKGSLEKKKIKKALIFVFRLDFRLSLESVGLA